LNESGRRFRVPLSGQHRPELHVPLEFETKQKGAGIYAHRRPQRRKNRKKMSPLISRREGRRSSSLPKHMRVFRGREIKLLKSDAAATSCRRVNRRHNAPHNFGLK